MNLLDSCSPISSFLTNQRRRLPKNKLEIGCMSAYRHSTPSFDAAAVDVKAPRFIVVTAASDTDRAVKAVFDVDAPIAAVAGTALSISGEVASDRKGIYESKPTPHRSEVKVKITPHPLGVVRGCGWQHLVVFINFGTNYCIGMPISIFLGFKRKLNAEGLCMVGTHLRLVLSRWTRMELSMLKMDSDGAF